MAVGYLLALCDHAGIAYGPDDVLGFADWCAEHENWSLRQAYALWSRPTGPAVAGRNQPTVSAVPPPRCPSDT